MGDTPAHTIDSSLGQATVPLGASANGLKGAESRPSSSESASSALADPKNEGVEAPAQAFQNNTRNVSSETPQPLSAAQTHPTNATSPRGLEPRAVKKAREAGELKAVLAETLQKIIDWDTGDIEPAVSCLQQLPDYFF